MSGGLGQFIRDLSNKARERRSSWLTELFEIDKETKILDLGSENGDNIRFVLGSTSFEPANVFLADIDREAIDAGAAKHGFTPVLLDESGKLPFSDGFFDVVFCSSVIEHVTVTKDEVWKIRDGRTFRDIAETSQRRFADEIRRVSKGYFVQTPARGFPIESHSWLPLAGQLPRFFLVPLLRLTNRFWIKLTIPDFYLLGPAEVAELFPDAELRYERFFGLVKSITAFRRMNS
jgi:SAM-dependent methyltransferase